MYEQKGSIIGQEQISEKLEIYISGRNLSISKSSQNIKSFLVAKLIQTDKPKKQILKTKIYDNNPNPNYVETLIIDYVFEVKQKLIFQIYQSSNPAKLIGKLESSVGQIFGSPTNGFIKPIKNQLEQETGKIILRCEKILKGKRRIFSTQIAAQNIPNLSWWWLFGGTFPFFRIFKKRKNDELIVYQSQVLGHTTNPVWKTFKIFQQRLCNLNEQMDIQIRFYSFSNNGNHTLIGSAFFSLLKLKKVEAFPISLNNAKKGNLIFKNVKRTVKYEFGDYIQNGLQLALTTCIDFTASNGNPDHQQSLHYSIGARKNQYQQAMSEILDILLEYDYDKLVPCFGFGAQVKHPKLDTMGKVHHCFPLNGNPDNPNIYQKASIIKSYRQILKYIKFSSPTKFSQLLKQTIALCKQFQLNQEKTEYMILFILTDGQIHDKQEVIDLLIQCNKLPLSIIIVGIGKGQFAIMHELDDDDCKMVDSKGNRTERDLVQFVEFTNFKNNGVALAKEVLQELPRQVEDYFELMGIQPNLIKRRQSDIEEQKLLQKIRINE